MREVRAIDTVNDTITVEAGVVLKEIQNAADRADRLFPLSLGAEGSCQIGGNISTNAGGVQVLRYGNMRNLVLGLEVVLPDGSVWDGLRGLRKDNTGYDMKQVFVGAEGTLGIITAAVLRLFPKPTASETAWIGVDAPTAAVALLGHMRGRLGDTVSAFELIGRPISDLLLSGVPGHEDPMQDIHPWYVLMDVTSQGPPGSLHTPLADALGAALEAGLVVDALIARPVQAARLWKMREPGRGPGSAGGVAHDVSVPVSRSRSSSSAPMPPPACPGIRRCAFGHVGDGNILQPGATDRWDGPRFGRSAAHQSHRT
jgi:FAD/FMN-containing dehydrogenase